MNVYMIREDGQSKLVLAETMQKAIDWVEDDFVREERENGTEGTEQEWREHYRTDLLESCELIGDVENYGSVAQGVAQTG